MLGAPTRPRGQRVEQREAAPPARAWARLRTALPLVAIFVVGSAVGVAHAAGVDTWKVMTDELLYEKLSTSVFQGSPLGEVRGHFAGVYSLLFPWVSAPAWWLFSPPAAFQLVHALNAVAMASVVFPTYLLARAVGLERWVAYLAAAIAMAVPWLSLSTLIATEPLAYPVFTWAALAIHRALTHPGPRSDALVLVAMAFAFLSRTQFLLLAPLLPVLIAVHELAFAARDGRRGERVRLVLAAVPRTVRQHRLLVGGYVVALLPGLVAFGPSRLRAVLGSYEHTAQGDLLPPGTLRSALELLASIGVAVAVVPLILAVAWALTALVRPHGRAEQGFALMLLALLVAIPLEVASFNLRFGQGFPQERYAFYLVPLLSVAMLRCLRGPGRPWPAVLAVGVGVTLMVGLPAYGVAGAPLFASPSVGFYQVLDGRAYDLGQLVGIADLDHDVLIQWGTGAITLVLAGLILARRPRLVTAVVGLAVLVYGVAQTLYVFPKAVDASTAGDYALRIPPDERDWVDENVPDGARVGMLPDLLLADEIKSRIIWWDVEFWNRSIRGAYGLPGANTYTEFFAPAVSIDRRDGRFLNTGDQLPYLVVPRDLRVVQPLVKRVVADGPVDPVELVEVERPYRAEWISSGTSRDGWVYEDGARVRFYPGAGGGLTARRVTFHMSTPPPAARYAIRGGTRVATGRLVPSLRGEREVTRTVTVCVPPGGASDVLIRADRITRIPADGRKVMLRIDSIATRPAPAATCRR